MFEPSVEDRGNLVASAQCTKLLCNTFSQWEFVTLRRTYARQRRIVAAETSQSIHGIRNCIHYWHKVAQLSHVKISEKRLTKEKAINLFVNLSVVTLTHIVQSSNAQDNVSALLANFHRHSQIPSSSSPLSLPVPPSCRATSVPLRSEPPKISASVTTPWKGRRSLVYNAALGICGLVTFVTVCYQLHENENVKFHSSRQYSSDYCDTGETTGEYKLTLLNEQAKEAKTVLTVLIRHLRSRESHRRTCHEEEGPRSVNFRQIPKDLYGLEFVYASWPIHLGRLRARASALSDMIRFAFLKVELRRSYNFIHQRQLLRKRQTCYIFKTFRYAILRRIARRRTSITLIQILKETSAKRVQHQIFNLWKASWFNSQRITTCMHLTREHLNTLEVSQALRFWFYHLIYIKKRLRLKLTFLLNRHTLQKLLIVWKTLAQPLRLQRTLTSIVARHEGRRLYVHAYHVWAFAFRHAIEEKELQRIYEQLNVKRCLRFWKTATAEQNRLKQQTTHVLSRYVHCTVRNALRDWAQSARATASLKFQNLKVHRVRIKRILLQWLNVSVQRYLISHAKSAVVSHGQRLLLFKSYKRWVFLFITRVRFQHLEATWEIQAKLYTWALLKRAFSKDKNIKQEQLNVISNLKKRRCLRFWRIGFQLRQSYLNYKERQNYFIRQAAVRCSISALHALRNYAFDKVSLRLRTTLFGLPVNAPQPSCCNTGLVSVTATSYHDPTMKGATYPKTISEAFLGVITSRLTPHQNQGLFKNQTTTTMFSSVPDRKWKHESTQGRHTLKGFACSSLMAIPDNVIHILMVTIPRRRQKQISNALNSWRYKAKRTEPLKIGQIVETRCTIFLLARFVERWKLELILSRTYKCLEYQSTLNTLKRFWDIWEYRRLICMKDRLALEVVVPTLESHALRNAWSVWKLETTHHQCISASMSVWIRAKLMNQITTLFSAWLQFAKTRQLERTLHTMLETSLLQSSLAIWITTSTKRQEQHYKASYLQRLTTVLQGINVLRLWKEEARKENRLQCMLKRINTLRHDRSCYKALTKWKQWARYQCMRRLVISIAYFGYERRAFLNIQKCFHYQLQRRCLLQKLLIKTTLLKWRKISIEAKQLSNVKNMLQFNIKQNFQKNTLTILFRIAAFCFLLRLRITALLYFTSRAGKSIQCMDMHYLDKNTVSITLGILDVHNQGKLVPYFSIYQTKLPTPLQFYKNCFDIPEPFFWYFRNQLLSPTTHGLTSNNQCIQQDMLNTRFSLLLALKENEYHGMKSHIHMDYATIADAKRHNCYMNQRSDVLSSPETFKNKGTFQKRLKLSQYFQNCANHNENIIQIRRCYATHNNSLAAPFQQFQQTFLIKRATPIPVEIYFYIFDQLRRGLRRWHEAIQMFQQIKFNCQRKLYLIKWRYQQRLLNQACNVWKAKHRFHTAQRYQQHKLAVSLSERRTIVTAWSNWSFLFSMRLIKYKKFETILSAKIYKLDMRTLVTDLFQTWIVKTKCHKELHQLTIKAEGSVNIYNKKIILRHWFYNVRAQQKQKQLNSLDNFMHQGYFFALWTYTSLKRAAVRQLFGVYISIILRRNCRTFFINVKILRHVIHQRFQLRRSNLILWQRWTRHQKQQQLFICRSLLNLKTRALHDWVRVSKTEQLKQILQKHIASRLLARTFSLMALAMHQRFSQEIELRNVLKKRSITRTLLLSIQYWRTVTLLNEKFREIQYATRMGLWLAWRAATIINKKIIIVRTTIIQLRQRRVLQDFKNTSDVRKLRKKLQHRQIQYHLIRWKRYIRENGLIRTFIHRLSFTKLHNTFDVWHCLTIRAQKNRIEIERQRYKSLILKIFYDPRNENHCAGSLMDTFVFNIQLRGAQKALTLWRNLIHVMVFESKLRILLKRRAFCTWKKFLYLCLKEELNKKSQGVLWWHRYCTIRAQARQFLHVEPLASALQPVISLRSSLRFWRYVYVVLCRQFRILRRRRIENLLNTALQSWRLELRRIVYCRTQLSLYGNLVDTPRSDLVDPTPWLLAELEQQSIVKKPSAIYAIRRAVIVWKTRAGDSKWRKECSSRVKKYRKAKTHYDLFEAVFAWELFILRKRCQVTNLT